jgi:type I restriction enzyme S subunit
LLFVEGNGSIDQIGRVATWDGSIPGCVHQNHLIRFRASERVLPEYALIWMMAPQGREQLIEQAISPTRPTIHRSFYFFICSLQ